MEPWQGFATTSRGLGLHSSYVYLGFFLCYVWLEPSRVRGPDKARLSLEGPMMRPLKILILEDNPFQLMVVHQMLNTFRIFDVLVAENMDAARRSLDKCGTIDVAICDLYVDGLAGLELIHELAVKREAAALIILSCAAPHIVESAVNVARKEGLRVLGCLPKPVTTFGLGQLLDLYQRPKSGESAS